MATQRSFLATLLLWEGGIGEEVCNPAQQPPGSAPLNPHPHSPQAPKAGHSNKDYEEVTNWYMILIMG